MDLLPTSEQQQIIDAAATYITDRLPLQRLKALQRQPEHLSVEQFKEIADLGWLGLGIEPDKGGVGYGPSEEVLLLREMGRAVVAPQLLFTTVAAHVAADAGDAELAGRLTSGAARACLAVANRSHDPEAAEPSYRLYESAGATLALVVEAGRALLVDLQGADIDPIPCMDTALSMGEIKLADRPLLADVDGTRAEVRGALLLAAYQVGLAERALEMIVEYAKIRETFGRPIGAYQAVRHPCAEMAARAEMARAQIFLASVSVAEDKPDAPVQVSAARVLAERAALLNTDDNIQLHGGIGVTDEFDAHFLMKRATVAPQWFGDRRGHLDLVLNTPVNVEALS